MIKIVRQPEATISCPICRSPLEIMTGITLIESDGENNTTSSPIYICSAVKERKCNYILNAIRGYI